MKVICLSNFKGGAGKTTLAGHLAVQAGLSGYGEVVLIDTDPQASLTDWWNFFHSLRTKCATWGGQNLRIVSGPTTETFLIYTDKALSPS